MDFRSRGASDGEICGWRDDIPHEKLLQSSKESRSRKNGASRDLSNVASKMQTTGSPAHQPPLFPSSSSDIDAFETAMRRAKCEKGFFVSFDYTDDAEREITRLWKEEKRVIIPLTVADLLEDNYARKLA